MFISDPTDKPSADRLDRVCRLLHRAALLIGAPALVVAIAYGGLAMWALLLWLVVLQIALVALTVSTEPVPGASPRGYRPGWAAIAVSADLLILAALLWFLVRARLDPATVAVPSPTASGFCLVFSIPLLGALHHFAHDRAVRSVESAVDQGSGTGTDGVHG
ncbi:hypothetical protein [Streptomyces anulatus]|uniref:hypothetical protein n=1 Tax=Streptomyces anulatus TaxID=1892 RepID=UPI001C25E903|nr:hypothetical protein [Streptomyces anulatus]